MLSLQEFRAKAEYWDIWTAIFNLPPSKIIEFLIEKGFQQINLKSQKKYPTKSDFFRLAKLLGYEYNSDLSTRQKM